jgi:hypothetical protein
MAFLKNKTLLVALILIFSAGLSNAQISLVQGDLPSVNDTLRFSFASPEQALSFQETGEDYYWDYSSLEHTDQGLEVYIPITQISSLLGFVFGANAYARNFSDIYNYEDLGVEGFENIYQVFNKTTSLFSFDGYVLVYESYPVPMAFSDKDEIMQFPFNYEQKDSTTFFGSLASADTLYYETQGYRINEGDGWGEIITPYGEFECLRIKTTLFQKDSLYLESMVDPMVTERTTYEYKWYAKSEKLPVLEITTMISEVEQIEVPIMIRYRDIFRPVILPPVADFSVENTEVVTNELVYFENLSTPEHAFNEYLWEFTPNNVAFHEDTDVNSINPIVSFTEVGNYDVKLTVINDAGNDEITKTSYITVSEPIFVSEIITAETFIIFPNPAASNIFIQSDAVIKEFSIQTLDGKIIKNGIINIDSGIDISNLSPGVYILNCTDILNKSFNSVFIKQ